MGNDFIHKVTKSLRKGFDREFKRLTLADLGFRGTSKKIRTISCVPFGLENFKEGFVYELHLDDGRIYLYKDRQRVGVCQEPPRSIALALKALGGKALGSFYKLREHSKLAEVVVGLNVEAKAGEAA
jgi:hypothetical protein